jgi:hypothetical protein
MGAVPLSEGEVQAKQQQAFENARKQRLRQAHKQCHANSHKLVHLRQQQQHLSALRQHSLHLSHLRDQSACSVQSLSAQANRARAHLGDAHSDAELSLQRSNDRAEREAESREKRELIAQARFAAAMAHEETQSATLARKDSLGIQRFHAHADRHRASFSAAKASASARAGYKSDVEGKSDGNEDAVPVAGVGDGDGLWNTSRAAALDMRGREWMAMFSKTRLHESGGSGPPATVAGTRSEPKAHKVSADLSYAKAKQKVDEERKSRANERARAAVTRERVRREKTQLEKGVQRQQQQAIASRKHDVQQKAQRARWGSVVEPASSSARNTAEGEKHAGADENYTASDEFCFDPAEWSVDLPLPSKLKMMQHKHHRQRQQYLQERKKKGCNSSRSRNSRSVLKDRPTNGKMRASSPPPNEDANAKRPCQHHQQHLRAETKAGASRQKRSGSSSKRRRAHEAEAQAGKQKQQDAVEDEELLGNLTSGKEIDEDKHVGGNVSPERRYKEGDETASEGKTPSTLSKRAEEAEREMMRQQQQQQHDESVEDEPDDEYESTLSTLSKRIQAIEEAIE